MIGARRFYREHRAEALACLGVVVSHYAFYCGHFEWAGGGAWGPRYLMIALPFALLPILAFFPLLREVRWLTVVMVVVVAAGIYVQLLPVLVNFDFDKTPEETRNFSPANAPFLWHTRTVIARFGEWHTLIFPAEHGPTGAGLRHPRVGAARGAVPALDERGGRDRPLPRRARRSSGQTDLLRSSPARPPRRPCNSPDQRCRRGR